MMSSVRYITAACTAILAVASLASISAHGDGPGGSGSGRDGKFIFERETFGGNGRTCVTCHSRETGTVSPLDALYRFLINPKDALFLHDGSDDGNGHGVTDANPISNRRQWERFVTTRKPSPFPRPPI